MKKFVAISGAAVLLVGLAAPTAEARPSTGLDGHCDAAQVDSERLPHTADALDGWFRACGGNVSAARPHTADGAERWLTDA